MTYNLDDLPELEMTILKLYFHENMELKEIADELSISIQKVRRYYNRGIFALRKKYNPAYFEKAYQILYSDFPKRISF